jgi:hypothetical protein
MTKKRGGWGKYNQAARNLFNKMRGKTIRLQIDYDLFLKLTSSNCFYCGAPPSNSCKRLNHPPYIYNGLDRMDPNGGYVADNIVPCCWSCNKMKSNRTTEQFLEHIRRILINLANAKES